MNCPICYLRMKKKDYCSNCGFRKEELLDAKHSYVDEFRRAGKGDKIIYSQIPPKDIDYKKLKKVTYFFGWLSIHNFLLKKNIKAVYGFSVMLIYFVLSALSISGYFYDHYIMSFSITFASVFFIFWVLDIVSIIRKKIKIPVVLKRDYEKYGKY